MINVELEICLQFEFTNPQPCVALLIKEKLSLENASTQVVNMMQCPEL